MLITKEKLYEDWIEDALKQPAMLGIKFTAKTCDKGHHHLTSETKDGKLFTTVREAVDHELAIIIDEYYNKLPEVLEEERKKADDEWKIKSEARMAAAIRRARNRDSSNTSWSTGPVYKPKPDRKDYTSDKGYMEDGDYSE